jgi:hypothetical protein
MNESKPLTRQLAAQILTEFDRLGELYESQIATPQREAEIRALEQSIGSALFAFGPELISAWMVNKTEYEPLIGGIATVLERVDFVRQQRASRINAMRAQQQAAPLIVPAAVPPAQPANVIELPKA